MNTTPVSKFCYTLILVCLLHHAGAQPRQVSDSEHLPSHPRLLLLKGEENAIVAQMLTQPAWGRVHATITTACNNVLLQPPIERKLIGRRLLSQSRLALQRLFYLAWAWRTTHDSRYLKRGEQEMLTIAAFPDWNPTHFLDVAEMTMAMAIGYDWLYDGLLQPSRDSIAHAIINKGLNPSKDTHYNGWLKNSNNWNQVCNAGISFGALAVFENQPTESAHLLNRAVKSIAIPMDQYQPDGAYPEGYNYWDYGTSFNVLFISAMEKAFDTDFNLSAAPGFLRTASYYENMTGLTGRSFNYSDCGSAGASVNPAMLWFAGKTKDPTLLWVERQNLLSKPLPTSERLLPAALLWGTKTDLLTIRPPDKTTWVGGGKTPVALLRTSWLDTAGIFVGIKGGSPAESHAHMDAGSFVMDAAGVRWSADLGMQEYESLESKGLNIWSMAQQSQRWQVFRYSNLAHSTLTVDDSLQQVQGYAPIVSSSADTAFKSAIVDLQSLYSKRLLQAKRGIAIVHGQWTAIRDELETGDSAATIRWTMLTPATVVRIKKDKMLLENQGRQLWLLVKGLRHVSFNSRPASPPNSWDAPNPGMTLVSFEVKMKPHNRQAILVLLQPTTSQPADDYNPPPLGDWPKQ